MYYETHYFSGKNHPIYVIQYVNNIKCDNLTKNLDLLI